MKLGNDNKNRCGFDLNSASGEICINFGQKSAMINFDAKSVIKNNAGTYELEEHEVTGVSVGRCWWNDTDEAYGEKNSEAKPGEIASYEITSEEGGIKDIISGEIEWYFGDFDNDHWKARIKEAEEDAYLEAIIRK